MRRSAFLHGAGAAGIAGMTAGACSRQQAAVERKKLFTFAFFTDVHVQPEQGAKEGFLAAIDKMNSLQPDFAIGGGDYVMDCLFADEARATVQYDLYAECVENFSMPVHHVIGNHEVFGIYVPEKVPENHPEWGKEMFRKRIGEGRTYRSFDHKGVHFVLLDSVAWTRNGDKPGYRYFGQIGAEQLAWLADDLGKLAPGTPVIAASHIPLFSFYTQIFNGFTAQTPDSEVITDGKALMEAFSGVKLLGHLEGHMHINELFAYRGTQYLDTGAVSAGWWGGPFHGHPEGFNMVTVWEDGVTAEYVTYGWDASKHKPREKSSAVFPKIRSMMG